MPEKVKIEKKLGEGAFGEVMLGTLIKHNEPIPVAIKQVTYFILD
jgi:hypothetical protein